MNFEGYLAVGKMMTIQFINYDYLLLQNPQQRYQDILSLIQARYKFG